jgi:hypothetical protein
MSKTFRFIPIQLSEKFFQNPDYISNEVQLLRLGKFFHEGQEVEITKDILKRMEKNFTEKVRKIDLMIDFAHQSDLEAAAWIQNIYLSEDGAELWASVDWTKEGEKSIREKKYRYLSADFQFNYVDNETLAEYGPTLFGAGLTNRPVVKGMQPTIELSESNESKLGDNKMTLEEMKKELDELKEKSAKKDAKIKELEEKLACKDKKMSEMENEKKLAEEKAQKEKEAAEKKAEEDKKLAEKKGEFDKLLSEGKAVEAQREAFMKDDMKTFIEKSADVNLSEKGSGSDQNDTHDKKSETPAQDKVIELAEKKAKEDKIDISMATSIVLSEDEKLKEEYEKETSL